MKMNFFSAVRCRITKGPGNITTSGEALVELSCICGEADEAKRGGRKGEEAWVSNHLTCNTTD